MTTRTITIAAESREEALIIVATEQLKSRIPEGFGLVKTSVLGLGHPIQLHDYLVGVIAFSTTTGRFGLLRTPCKIKSAATQYSDVSGPLRVGGPRPTLRRLRRPGGICSPRTTRSVPSNVSFRAMRWPAPTPRHATLSEQRQTRQSGPAKPQAPCHK